MNYWSLRPYRDSTFPTHGLGLEIQIFGLTYVFFFLNNPKCWMHTPRQNWTHVGVLLLQVLCSELSVKEGEHSLRTSLQERTQLLESPSGDSVGRQVCVRKPHIWVLCEDTLAAWTSWGSTWKAEGRPQEFQNQLNANLLAFLAVFEPLRSRWEWRKTANFNWPFLFLAEEARGKSPKETKRSKSKQHSLTSCVYLHV